MRKLFTSIRTHARASATLVATLAAVVATVAAPAAAHAGTNSGWAGARHDHAVFVLTNNPAGNAIVGYDRAGDGTLTQAGVYATAGLGGQLDGSVADHLASQGSLVLDRPAGLLYAVNAGSNTVSMFRVDGAHLALLQVISSGGTFPVSVAVHGDVVYVLNGLNGASVQGYLRIGARLVEVPQWRRELGLDESFQGTSAEFLHTPGQVVFTPDGAQLLVSTKDNGNDVDVFGVDRQGGLSAAPVVNGAGAVPFAMTFDSSGHLLLTETGTSSIVSFEVEPGGRLTPVGTALTGQAASCWIAPVGPNLFYVSNAGSATETGIADEGGDLAALGNTATDPGTIDASATPSGRFLYVETGTDGIVDEFSVRATGALAEIGSVTVPAPLGSEGIAAG